MSVEGHNYLESYTNFDSDGPAPLPLKKKVIPSEDAIKKPSNITDEQPSLTQKNSNKKIFTKKKLPKKYKTRLTLRVLQHVSKKT